MLLEFVRAKFERERESEIGSTVLAVISRQ